MAPKFQNTQNRSPLLNSFHFWVTKINVSQSQSIKIHSSESYQADCSQLTVRGVALETQTMTYIFLINDPYYGLSWVSKETERSGDKPGEKE